MKFPMDKVVNRGNKIGYQVQILGVTKSKSKCESMAEVVYDVIK